MSKPFFGKKWVLISDQGTLNVRTVEQNGASDTPVNAEARTIADLEALRSRWNETLFPTTTLRIEEILYH